MKQVLFCFLVFSIQAHALSDYLESLFDSVPMACKTIRSQARLQCDPFDSDPIDKLEQKQSTLILDLQNLTNSINASDLTADVKNGLLEKVNAEIERLEDLPFADCRHAYTQARLRAQSCIAGFQLAEGSPNSQDLVFESLAFHVQAEMWFNMAEKLFSRLQTELTHHMLRGEFEEAERQKKMMDQMQQIDLGTMNDPSSPMISPEIP